MPYSLTRIAVEDFAKWKATFVAGASTRKAHGSNGAQFYRSLDRPNEVVVIVEFANLEKARQLFQSQEFRDAIKRGGVSGIPEVVFLDEAERLAH